MKSCDPRITTEGGKPSKTTGRGFLESLLLHLPTWHDVPTLLESSSDSCLPGVEKVTQEAAWFCSKNRSREALQPCLFASSNMVLITLKNRWNISLPKLSKSSSQDTSYPITKLQTLDFKPEFSVTCCSLVGPEAYPKQNPKQLPTNVYSLQCVHLLTCSLSAFVAVQAERRWVEISSGKIISTCMWSSSEGPPTVIWARAKLRKFQDCRRK